MTTSEFVAVAKVSELPAGSKKLVVVNGVEVVLCNSSDNIYAVRNLCTHAYEALDTGRMKNGWIACPVHGARFDLATGAALNPPATTPIDTYEVRIEGDDILVGVTAKS